MIVINYINIFVFASFYMGKYVDFFNDELLSDCWNDDLTSSMTIWKKKVKLKFSSQWNNDLICSITIQKTFKM